MSAAAASSAPAPPGAPTVRVLPGMGHLPPGAWERLWQRDSAAQVYQSEAWLTAWERHAAPGALRILLVESAGRLVGALPLERIARWRTGTFRGVFWTLASASSAAYPLDMGPLLAPDFRGAALEALSAACLALGGADGFLFELHAAGSPAAELLARVSARARRPLLERPLADSHLVQLAPTYEAFLETLGARTRRNVRAYAKKFNEAGPQNRIVVAQTPADFARLLAAMAEQKARRFAELGRASTLDEQRLAAFLNEALPALHAQGRLTGLMAMVGERIGATQLYLHDEHGHAYSYNSSFDLEFKELRLHYLLETERFRRAIEAGYRLMDLSTGHAEHKQHWTGGLTRPRLSSAVLLTPRGRLLHWACEHARRLRTRSTPPPPAAATAPEGA